jgi:hypothetical protein
MNGVFSVRSAHHLRIQQRKIDAGIQEFPTTSAAYKGWLALWGASVLCKVKINVWRLKKNGLAVDSELQCRKIKESLLCCLRERGNGPSQIVALSTLKACVGTSQEFMRYTCYHSSC